MHVFIALLVFKKKKERKKKKQPTMQWWHMPIPALGRQRLEALSELEASLVYRVSSRTARADTQRNSVLGEEGRPPTKFLCVCAPAGGQ